MYLISYDKTLAFGTHRYYLVIDVENKQISGVFYNINDIKFPYILYPDRDPLNDIKELSQLKDYLEAYHVFPIARNKPIKLQYPELFI